MADRPTPSRVHSDPTEQVTGRRGSQSRDPAADFALPEDASTDHPGDNISHSNPDTPLPRDYDDSQPRERQRVRFGLHRDPSNPHQPLDLHQAKPKKSNFLQRGHSSGSGSNEATEQNTSHVSLKRSSVSSISPLPDEAIKHTDHQDGDNASASRPTSPSGKPNLPPSLPAFSLYSPDNEKAELSPSQHIGEMAAQSARSRAEQLSKSLGPEPDDDEPRDFETISPQASPPPSPQLGGQSTPIPKDMRPYMLKKSRNHFYHDDESESEADSPGINARVRRVTRRLFGRSKSDSPIVLSRYRAAEKSDGTRAAEEGRMSGYATPTPEIDQDPEYVRRPKQFRKGILGILLDTYGHDGVGAALGRHEPGIAYYRHRNQLHDGGSTPSPVSSPPRSGHSTPTGKSSKLLKSTRHPYSPPGSGTATPTGKSSRLFARSPRSSVHSLIQASAALSATAASNDARPMPEMPRRTSGAIEQLKAWTPRRRHYDEIHQEIEELRARHQYMIKSCKALMRYGAPTHRLEEYMRKSARRLMIEGQFLYLPGCMVISFDSPETGTTEVKIVREDQGVNLSKLREMHDIYKGVIHRELTAQEANTRLDEMMQRKPLYSTIVRIFFYGLASASVGPFGFGGRPIDIPVAFLLGVFLGFLQLCLSTRSESYSNVFEISAAVLTSFAARGLGSIKGADGDNIFCFPALAQSAIALILPGFIVLSAALELQSKSMIAGSVRMVYAIIYSLFLGFGITVGVAVYGTIDSHAAQAGTCPDQLPSNYWKFIFVPIFTISLCVVNQAHWRQMPVMVGISMVGYIVNFFSAQRFSNNAQIANTLGALAVGLLGNAYSRLYQGMSAAAILPAIFVQVPSGIAASGSLISGVVSANQLLDTNSTGTTTVSNGTQAGSSGVEINNTMLNVGFTMIQIAIGLTVGLFFSSLIVYPFGKKRSGLFSF